MNYAAKNVCQHVGRDTYLTVHYIDLPINSTLKERLQVALIRQAPYSVVQNDLLIFKNAFSVNTNVMQKLYSRIENRKEVFDPIIR